MLDIILGSFIGAGALNLVSGFVRNLQQEESREESRKTYNNWVRSNYLSNNYGPPQQYQNNNYALPQRHQTAYPYNVF